MYSNQRDYSVKQSRLKPSHNGSHCTEMSRGQSKTARMVGDTALFSEGKRLNTLPPHPTSDELQKSWQRNANNVRENTYSNLLY